MRWKGRQQSSNVEDRRGLIPGGKKTKFGLGAIIVIVIALFLGENPMNLLQLLDGGNSTQEQVQSNIPRSAEEDELAAFVKVVLKETEDVWHPIFKNEFNQLYKEPTLVLFTSSVSSACGNASAASGPFYCPGDQKLYIDLSFYQDLKDKFKAPGDFAMAYVVAHEVGHHVQNLLGATGKLDRQRGRISQEEYNELSVRLELQADFFAGVWAHYADRTKGIVEDGDIEEALTAANAIGDDRLQKQAQGYVVPESFTHGTSAQRMRWFKRGYETGDIKQGNTFSARNL